MKSYSGQQVSQQQDNGLLNQTSITPTRPLVSIKVYASSSSKHEPDILLGQMTQLRTQIWIQASSAILLNHQTSRTKVIPLQELEMAETKMSNDQTMLLAQIIPKINQNGQYCFDIRKKSTSAVLRGKQYSRNTFINVNPLGQNQQKMYLKQGDILKFGRESYSLSTCRSGKGLRVRWFDRVHHELVSVQQKCCRICLCSQMSNKKDYLISPCSCAGSCAFIHLQCLRRWLLNRVLVKENANLKTYNMKYFSCEICKSFLPKFVKIDDQVIQILPIHFRNKDYIILQKLSEEMDEELFHCIQLEQSSDMIVRIGRGDRSDLVLHDMSISRKHAKLYINSGEIHLEDDQSKFGTFVVLQGSLQNCRQLTLMSGKYTFKIAIAE